MAAICSILREGSGKVGVERGSPRPASTRLCSFKRTVTWWYICCVELGTIYIITCNCTWWYAVAWCASVCWVVFHFYPRLWSVFGAWNTSSFDKGAIVSQMISLRVRYFYTGDVVVSCVNLLIKLSVIHRLETRIVRTGRLFPMLRALRYQLNLSCRWVKTPSVKAFK